MKPKLTLNPPDARPADALTLAATRPKQISSQPGDVTRRRIRVVSWQSRQFVAEIRPRTVVPLPPIESWQCGGLNE